jgi:hypothetical protein
MGLVTLSTSWSASAQGRETAGVITEIKIGRGRAEVKAIGGSEWRPAAPLLALRAGDEVRVSSDAVVVVLMSGGRGSIRVDAATSPLVVASAAPAESKLEKARTLVEGSLAFLAASVKEQPKAVLSTRADAKPPVILTPRNGPVLPDSLVFEWQGSQLSRYTVRIADVSGVVLERKGVLGSRFEYPADAPRLRAGTRYTVQVLSGTHPPQETQFEVVEAGLAEAIRQDLASLDDALGSGVSPNSRTAVRAGLLAGRGLVHDARLLVVRSLTADPDEPALHMLLGQLYLQSGLTEQAAEAYDEAHFLLTQGN